MKLQQKNWAAVNKVGEEWASAKRQLASALPDSPDYRRLQAYAENMERQARNTIVEKIMQDLPESRYDRDNEQLDYAVNILEQLITERLPKFDGSGGNLSQYTNMCIGYLMKEHPYSTRQDQGEGKHKIAKKYTASEEDDRYITYVSLDAQVRHEDDDSTARKNLQPDPNSCDLGAEVLVDELLLSLTSNILNMKNRGKTQDHYNSMLFTDTIVNYIHHYDDVGHAARHEQELFKAMEIAFLDFFMENPCRSVPQIGSCPTAPYSRLVEGKPDTPCPLPLEAKVFLSYLERIENHPITASAWSQAKSKYWELMKLICLNS